MIGELVKIYHGGGTEMLWRCKDCGTDYDTAGNGEMRSCPACRDKKDGLEKQYWDKRQTEMRSIANDILARILNKVGV